MGESRIRALTGSLLALLLMATVGQPTVAQPGRGSASISHAVGAGVGLMRFAPDDPETPGYFEIEAVAPAIVYNRSGMTVVGLYAGDRGIVDGRSADLDFVDVSLLFRSDLTPFGTIVGGRIEPFVPIALSTAYRRVRQTVDRRTLILFEYQTLGVGTGVGARSGGRRWGLEAHATPSIGFASRSFGGSTGLLYGIDSEVWMTFGPVVGRIGLSLGYGFSWQRWRVGGPEAVTVAGSGRFDFTGREHVLRLGVAW